ERDTISEIDGLAEVARAFLLEAIGEHRAGLLNLRAVHHKEPLRRGDGLRAHRARSASVIDIEGLLEVGRNVTAGGKATDDVRAATICFGFRHGFPHSWGAAAARITRFNIERRPAQGRIEIARGGED